MPRNTPAKAPTRRKPLKTMPLFIEAHTEHERRLYEYLHMARSNYQTLSHDLLEQLAPKGAALLASNNTQARINFARIASTHMAELAEGLDNSVPLSFITLAPKRFVVGIHSARYFDIKPLQSWACEQLAGLNYVGVVEAALYTNSRMVRFRTNRIVSFHVHAIAWRAECDLLDAIKKRINQNCQSLVPGIDPAHWRPLRKQEVRGQTIYMCKAPLNDHRVYPKRRGVGNSVGDITSHFTGRYRQRKQDQRPGDRVRMIRAMQNQYLDRLAFAGGDGAAVLASIKREALKPWGIYKITHSREVMSTTASGKRVRRTIVL